MREVRDLIGRSRLVSIIGPGGVGKSRLALRVAAQLEGRFRDGCRLVELDSTADPSLLPELIAASLEVPESSGRDSTDALAAYVGDRELLVVLDNCEQLRAECVSLLAAVLPLAPGLRVLVTSQEVLGVPGETVYRLKPLVMPDAPESADIAEVAPAVALFADRAASALNGFRLTEDNVVAVIELCRRLDGLPLAIELAAAQARVLLPSQVLDRLSDRFQLLTRSRSAVPARQQSLRAAVEWSYTHCGEVEQLVWKRLSVFPGSFDLAAAVALCSDLGPVDVESTIGELVDRSVLMSEPHASGMRYRLLESIREFGRLKLADSSERHDGPSEEELRLRHLDWYTRQASEFDRAWFGPRQRESLERLRMDLPNIRAALSFASESPARTDRGLRLAGDLSFFWRVTAFREGEQWLARLLEADGEPSTGRARALVALAWMLSAHGDPRATAIADEAVATAERFEPSLVPQAKCILATPAGGQDPASTIAPMQAALAEAERLGTARDRAFVMHNLGWNLGLAGQLIEAEHYFAGSVALCAEAGELSSRGAMQLRRALVRWMSGDLEEMAAMATEALRASRVVDDAYTSANAVSLIAVASVGRRDRLAASLFGAAERFWTDANGSIVTTPPWQALLDGAKDRCRMLLHGPAFDQGYRHGWDHGLEDAIAAALGERPERRVVPLAQRDFGLTRRELEIVDLVTQGLSNKQIAQRLVISSRTADTHVQNVLTKTGFHNRSQVAAWRASQVQAPA